MSDSLLEPMAAIVCDDLRQETSGKDILIGVYRGDMLVNDFPIPLKLAIWMPLKVISAGDVVDFKVGVIDSKTEKTILETKGANFSVSRSDIPFVVRLPNVAIIIEGATLLHIGFKQSDGPWKIASQLAVELKKST
jgi:hypothetical protein